MPGRSEREHAISTPKPIQLILARQLASSLAMPIIIVDTLGTLIYYNEPAEKLLAQRFEETGEMPAERWGAVFDVQDEERRPVPSHARRRTSHRSSTAITPWYPMCRAASRTNSSATGRGGLG